MIRRSLLTGLLTAPLVVRDPSILMPVRGIQPASSLLSGLLFELELQMRDLAWQAAYMGLSLADVAEAHKRAQGLLIQQFVDASAPVHQDIPDHHAAG